MNEQTTFRVGVTLAIASGIACMFVPLPWAFLIWGAICLALFLSSDPAFASDCRSIWRDLREEER